METVAHLWNVNRFMTRLECPLATELQTFYMQACRNLGDEVELPKNNFGPSAMCSHCGSLWSTMDYQVRISRGRKMSKSISKIVQSMNDQAISKVRATLAKKSMKNEMNKLVIKCSVCSKKTELPFKKKNRLKQVKLNNSQTEVSKDNRKKKKKKKKSRDKTAGLNIPECLSKSSNRVNESKMIAKSPVATIKISNNKTPASSKKSKKLNIERLKHIVNCSMMTPPAKKRSLRSFLAEL